MRQKIPYGIFGFICGMAVAVYLGIPIIQFVTGKQEGKISGLYLFFLILISGIVGAFVGLNVDKNLNAEGNKGVPVKANNFITKYLGFLALGTRRVEGNYIIYEVHTLRNFIPAAYIFFYYFFIRRYIPEPLGEILQWVVYASFFIANFPIASDSARAISQKIVKNVTGKKELWYEMAKNVS